MAKFTQISNLKRSRYRYGGKTLFYSTYKVKKGNLVDVSKFVTKIKNKIAEKYPNAKMSVPIKYSTCGHPVTTPFFGVNEETIIRAPYDYNGEENKIEEIMINFILR